MESINRSAVLLITGNTPISTKLHTSSRIVELPGADAIFVSHTLEADVLHNHDISIYQNPITTYDNEAEVYKSNASSDKKRIKLAVQRAKDVALFDESTKRMNVINSRPHVTTAMLSSSSSSSSSSSNAIIHKYYKVQKNEVVVSESDSDSDSDSSSEEENEIQSDDKYAGFVYKPVKRARKGKEENDSDIPIKSSKKQVGTFYSPKYHRLIPIATYIRCLPLVTSLWDELPLFTQAKERNHVIEQWKKLLIGWREDKTTIHSYNGMREDADLEYPSTGIFGKYVNPLSVVMALGAMMTHAARVDFVLNYVTMVCFSYYLHVNNRFMKQVYDRRTPYPTDETFKPTVFSYLKPSHIFLLSTKGDLYSCSKVGKDDMHKIPTSKTYVHKIETSESIRKSAATEQFNTFVTRVLISLLFDHQVCEKKNKTKVKKEGKEEKDSMDKEEVADNKENEDEEDEEVVYAGMKVRRKNEKDEKSSDEDESDDEEDEEIEKRRRKVRKKDRNDDKSSDESESDDDEDEEIESKGRKVRKKKIISSKKSVIKNYKDEECESKGERVRKKRKRRNEKTKVKVPKKQVNIGVKNPFFTYIGVSAVNRWLKNKAGNNVIDQFIACHVKEMPLEVPVEVKLSAADKYNKEDGPPLPTYSKLEGIPQAVSAHMQNVLGIDSSFDSSSISRMCIKYVVSGSAANAQKRVYIQYDKGLNKPEASATQTTFRGLERSDQYVVQKSRFVSVYAHNLLLPHQPILSLPQHHRDILESVTELDQYILCRMNAPDPNLNEKYERQDWILQRLAFFLSVSVIESTTKAIIMHSGGKTKRRSFESLNLGEEHLHPLHREYTHYANPTTLYFHQKFPQSMHPLSPVLLSMEAFVSLMSNGSAICLDNENEFDPNFLLKYINIGNCIESIEFERRKASLLSPGSYKVMQRFCHVFHTKMIRSKVEDQPLDLTDLYDVYTLLMVLIENEDNVYATLAYLFLPTDIFMSLQTFMHYTDYNDTSVYEMLSELQKRAAWENLSIGNEIAEGVKLESNKYFIEKANKMKLNYEARGDELWTTENMFIIPRAFLKETIKEECGDEYANVDALMETVIRIHTNKIEVVTSDSPLNELEEDVVKVLIKLYEEKGYFMRLYWAQQFTPSIVTCLVTVHENTIRQNSNILFRMLHDSKVLNALTSINADANLRSENLYTAFQRSLGLFASVVATERTIPAGMKALLEIDPQVLRESKEQIQKKVKELVKTLMFNIETGNMPDNKSMADLKVHVSSLYVQREGSTEMSSITKHRMLLKFFAEGLIATEPSRKRRCDALRGWMINMEKQQIKDTETSIFFGLLTTPQSVGPYKGEKGIQQIVNAKSSSVTEIVPFVEQVDANKDLYCYSYKVLQDQNTFF